MKIELELTDEQLAAVTYVATLAQPAPVPLLDSHGRQLLEVDGTPKTEPLPPVDPEAYLRARIDEVIASYAEQAQREEVATVTEAFKLALEADRDAVFAALKIERSTQ